MKCLLVFFFISFSIISFGQIPPGYYDNAIGFNGSLLRQKLNDIIKGHTEYPYTSGGTDVWDILKVTDRDTLNSNNVILLYTGWTRNGNAEYNSGSGWNREHVWAKSRGDFGTTNGPGTDVHALRPVDVTVNSARNNRWFAECTFDHEYVDGDGPTGNYYDFFDYIWMPREEVKGDVARMIFYMATRYDGENGEPDLRLIDYLPTNDNTQEPISAKLSDLLQWNEEDPVSDWERNRNDVIYYDYQNNRNPFIDHPEYAMLIWEDDIIQDVGQEELDFDSISFSAFPNPASNKLTVSIDGHIEEYTIQLIDALGKVVYQSNKEEYKEYILDISDLDSGYYQLIIIIEESSTLRKSIVID